LSVEDPPPDSVDAAQQRLSGLLDAYGAKRADLIRLFTARMGSAADAEDLIQDLFVKLSTMTVTETVDNPSAFLYRAAVNLMLDRARGQRRSLVRDDAWGQTRGARIGAETAADEPSPEQSAHARQRLRRLVEAVRGLPPQTRRAFELHKLEGLSHAETAQRLGISRKTVEKQISVALRSLISRLGKTDL
jgi:RNA polymerase sigma factor (sigma-70 family)